MCNEPNGTEYVCINRVGPFFLQQQTYSFLPWEKKWPFVYFSRRFPFGVVVPTDPRIWHDQHSIDVTWQRFKCGLGRTVYCNVSLKYTTTAGVLWESKTKKQQSLVVAATEVSVFIGEILLLLRWRIFIHSTLGYFSSWKPEEKSTINPKNVPTVLQWQDYYTKTFIFMVNLSIFKNICFFSFLLYRYIKFLKKKVLDFFK